MDSDSRYLSLKSQLELLPEIHQCWDLFSDTLIQTGDGSVLAPSLILAGGSLFLRKLLLGVEAIQETVLVLPDYRIQDIRQMLYCLLNPNPEYARIGFLDGDSPLNFLFPVFQSTKVEDVIVKQPNKLLLDSIEEKADNDLVQDFSEYENDSSDNEGKLDADLDNDNPDEPGTDEVHGDLSEGPELLSKDEAELRVEKHLAMNQKSKLYSCNLCQGDFSSKLKKIVTVHILKHLNIYLFKCDECGKMFRQLCNFTRHMKPHREGVPRSRKVEGMKKNQISQMEKYSTRSEIEVQDICKLTQNQLNGKLISFKQGLALASNVIEKENHVYRCKLCGKVCGRMIGNCRDHVWRTHYNVYLYQCPELDCGRRFRKLTDFKDHVNQHEEKKSQLRNLVERNQTNLSSLATFHLINYPIDVTKERGFEIASLYFYHDPVLRLYKCKLCAHAHARLQGSRNHVLANHLNQVYLFKCLQCGKRFRYENQFKLHIVVHNEGKFVCSQCGKQLVTKRYLVQHERTAHGTQEIHCQEAGCKYHGKTLIQMERHRKVYHEKDRSDWHFCEICAKPFPYINDLKVHVSRCAEGKSQAFKSIRMKKYINKEKDGVLTCVLCNQTSKSYRFLTDHLRKNHNILEQSELD